MLKSIKVLFSMSALLLAFVGCSSDDDDPVIPTYSAAISVTGVNDATHASAFKATAAGKSLNFVAADFSGGTLSGLIADLQDEVEVTLTVDNSVVTGGSYAIAANKKTVNNGSKSASFSVTFTPDGNGGGVDPGTSLIPNHNFADGLGDWFVVHGSVEDFVFYPSDNGMQLWYEGGGLKEIFSPQVATAPGKMYTLEVVCDVLGPVGGDGTNVKIRFYSEVLDEFGQTTFISEVNYFLEETDGFEKLTFTMPEVAYAAVAPDGAAFLNVTFAHWHATPEVYIEEVLVNEYTAEN